VVSGDGVERVGVVRGGLVERGGDDGVPATEWWGGAARRRGETGAAFGRVLRPWNLKPGEETGSRAVCAVAKGNKPYERLDRGVRFYRLKRGREKKKT